MMKFYRIGFLFLISILFFSCTKEEPEEESKWNPNFSLAIGYTSLGMNYDSGFDTLLLILNPITGLPYWTEEVDIPLSYTMPFDMGQLNDFSEEIVSVMFRLNSYNGFPNPASGQVYLLDAFNIIVDSVFSTDPLTMESGIINGNGETINSTHNQTDVYFDESKIDKLISVRSILVNAEISNVTLDTSLVDYYPEYTLDIQLGLQVELRMSISSK